MNIISKLFHKHSYKRTLYFGHVPVTACTVCGDIIHYGRIREEQIKRNQRMKFEHV